MIYCTMSACFRLLMPIQHLYGAVISEVHSSFDSNLLSQENGLEGDPDINTNTREQGFEDVSQAQCIDGKAKGRATTEVDIMRGGVDAVTDASAGQLQVFKRDSKSASDPKSSKKGKEESGRSTIQQRAKVEEVTMKETTGCQSSNNYFESVKFRILGRVKEMWEFMETFGNKYESV